MAVIATGLDYSARRLPGASIRAAGYKFVNRYLWFPGQRYPALNAAEYRDLAANGIEVHAIYEQNTNDPAGGYDAGVRMATQAVASARDAGLPLGHTIYMCADAWLSTHGIPVTTAMRFLDGARSVINPAGYLTGAYGFADFVYAAQDGKRADRFWLCGAESGVRNGIHHYQWNNGRVYVDGLECDLNKQYLPMLEKAPGGGGTQTPVGSDDTMIFVGVYDHENKKWASDERFLLNGGLITGGFTSADVQAARADSNNGPVAVLGLRHEVFTDLRIKSDTMLAAPDLLGRLTEVMKGISIGAPDIKGLASALADENDRRDRDGDPTTGQVS
jgi:hypothetical protein